MHHAMAERLARVDVSAVPAQPAAVATRCPVRADLDHSPALLVHRAPVDPSEIDRAERTRAHVTATWDRLVELAHGDPTVVRIHGATRAEAEERTIAALTGPARMLVGAALPTDHAAHRLGRRVVLVRPDPARAVGWVPVEVRRHLFTRPAQGTVATSSPLDHPHPAGARPVADTGYRANRVNENGLHLAHLWRLLESLDAVDADQPATGGLVDANGDLWWLDLDDPRCPVRWSATPVSMLAHYDHAFAVRLRVIGNRLAREVDPSVERIVPPVRIGQCATCPWEALCLRELEAVDHVSLLPRSTVDQYHAHADRGVTTRAQIAALDWPTAHVMHGDTARAPAVDLVALTRIAEGFAPDTPVADLLRPTNPRRPPLQLPLFGPLAADEPLEPLDPDESGGELPEPERPVEPLVATVPLDPVRTPIAEHGITTVADLSRLDARTASYSTAPAGHLPTVIDQARAALAGRPFLARGVGHPTIRRADVEVDVDMENVEEGVYLWGTLTTGTADALAVAGLDPGYLPFFSWAPMDPIAQAEVFTRFWRWLGAARKRCAEAGLTFAAYCYTSAEHQKMLQIRHGAPDHLAMPSAKEIDALVRSPDWVDLYDVVRNDLVVGHGLGLKRMAPLAGFRWRDPDAGGLQSMTWYREAVEAADPAVRAENRTRLLAYNEDDVRATHALRCWLDAGPIESITAWTPPSRAHVDEPVSSGSAPAPGGR
jgi:predicted RecB family nuclease